MVHNFPTLALAIICFSSAAAMSRHPAAETNNCKHKSFPNKHCAPFLAVLTEPDAASSSRRRQETVNVIQSALSARTDDNDEESLGGIDVISIRVDSSAQEDELRILVREVMNSVAKISLDDAPPQCMVVVNDRVDVAIECQAHGVHVKEKDATNIGSVRQRLVESSETHAHVIVGSSCHSISSAVQAAEAGADYLFVGTCFPTQTHPEKAVLEGPQLVGDVRKALDEQGYHDVPCLAIGGINEANCFIPVLDFGANGVAAIRSVTQAENPRETVAEMKRRMKCHDI